VAHHLVFVENEVAKGEPKDVVFKRIGLEDHIAGCDALPVSDEESPCDKAGILFAWRSRGDDQIIVKRDQQDWMKSASGYWVGVWKDKLPTEEQLRRNYMQKGQWIELKGGKWKLPTPATIDKDLALNDDGTWKYVPIRELSWYSEECEKRYADFQIDEADGKMSMRVAYNPLETINLIIRALRINYRITPEVVHMMRLITERNISEAYGMMFGLTFTE
jgi:hypothetical protein